MEQFEFAEELIYNSECENFNKGTAHLNQI